MGMKSYVARRVAWAAFATYIILTITFLLMAVTPDAGASLAAFNAAQTGGNATAAQQAYQVRHGVSGSLWQQYVHYMVNFAQFNWGWSTTRSQPVTTAIAQAYPYSLQYGAPSVIIATVFGVLIGLYSATHQYELEDYVATFTAFFGISIPNFWFGIILILIFGVTLGWVPVVYNTDLPTFSVANVEQLILPIVVLTTSSIASQMRYARAEALEYVQAEFVKTARAKGADERRVLSRHILRPALVPLMTILVSDLLGVVLTSSYVVEVVFGIPGLGRLNYNAIVNQDTALVLGTTLIPVFIAVIGNLLQDIAYTVVDPRINLGDD